MFHQPGLTRNVLHYVVEFNGSPADNFQKWKENTEHEKAMNAKNNTSYENKNKTNNATIQQTMGTNCN